MHDLRREGMRGRRLPFLVVTIIVALAGWIYAVGDPATGLPLTARPQSTPHSYGTLPLSFEENRGQTDARVKFLARGSGYGLFLTATDAVLELQGTSKQTINHGEAKSSVIRLALKNANPTPEVAGIDPLAGRSSYFIGRDPKKWRTNIPSFGGVRLRNVYPGVNLVYRGEQGRLEYDLEVSPKADPVAHQAGH